MENIVDSTVSYLMGIDPLELSGLIFGLLAVYFLIKENIWTWPTGIAYVLVSFVIFINNQLYGDFILHIIFLILNIYGWYYWIFGKSKQEDLPVSTWGLKSNILVFIITCGGVWVFGYFLDNIQAIFPSVPPSALPYWDASTSVLSVTGMYLTTRKKLENWYYWFVVDILATGIYIYKGIYFYAILYFIYIGLAIAGFLAWKKSMLAQSALS